MRVNLTCPTCGMSLDDPRSQGHVVAGETYCCKECAAGKKCTCLNRRITPKKAGNRRGDMGQRNPENSRRDRNYNEEVDTSGRLTGINKQETRKAPRRMQSHGFVDANGEKLPRGRTKERSSMREESRGRSEFRGALNSRLPVDRVGTTGTKSQ